MRPIAPRIVGLEEEHIDGENFAVLPAARAVDEENRPVIVSRWRLSPPDRDRIIAGEDVFLVVVGERMVPVGMTVGWPYGELEK